MGYNYYGQLGMGSKLFMSITTPVKVLNGAYSGTTYLGDDSNNKITAVAVSEYHSIALASDGTVYTWGSSISSTPVKVLNGAYSGTTYLGDDSNNKITAIAAGKEHYIALASDGTVYTWV